MHLCRHRAESHVECPSSLPSILIETGALAYLGSGHFGLVGWPVSPRDPLFSMSQPQRWDGRHLPQEPDLYVRIGF